MKHETVVACDRAPLRIYIAGAWVEQHQRARPMIARVREAGLIVTCDWTQAEGDVCACGHHRQEHVPYTGTRGSGCSIFLPTGHVGDDTERCPCTGFNGIGVGGDYLLTAENRRKYAQADLDGVLSADIVWLLAANSQGSSGAWVELGAALTDRLWKKDAQMGTKIIVVSGAKWQRTIFTELADHHFDTDEAALKFVEGLQIRATARAVITKQGRR